MKIFIDARPASGGIQRSLIEMVRRFRTLPEHAAAIELTIYGGDRLEGSPVPLEAESRSRLRRHLGDAKRVALESFSLPRRVRRAEPDAFFSPTGFLPRRIGCPSVVQCHDLWLLRHPETKRGGVITAYERRGLVHALEHADRIVVPSRSVLQEFEEQFPRLVAKVRHIYHPLAPCPSPETSTAHASSDPEPPYFLTVGTLEPRKNLERLIEAHRGLWQRTKIPLILVGPNGWRQDHVVEMIERSPGIRWLGAVDEATLDRLYRRASALVQVSLCEGFSYPVVEALQRGAPLVLSDLPVHREIAGPCATYCDPRDRLAVATAMETAVSAGADRDESRESALRRIALLEDERYVDRFVEVFREVC